MRHTVELLVAAIMGFAPHASAIGHSDFSGTWKMDPARSESAHQEIPVESSTLEIRVADNEVSVETTRSEGGKPDAFHERLTFRLDGTELTETGQGGVQVKCRARWDGPKLVTETHRNVNDSTVSTLYVYMLSGDAGTMTVDQTLTVQHGYQGLNSKSSGHGRDVYVRVSK